MADAVAALLDDGSGIAPLLRDCGGDRNNVHYATFGHSMGAWVAFAMAQELRCRAGAPGMPRVMFASCNRAPHLVGHEHDVHAVRMHTLGLGDADAAAAFWRGMAERYGESGMSPAIKKLMLPLLRADFEIIETWDPTEGERPTPAGPADGPPRADALLERMSPFAFPIVAVGAVDDRRYTPEQLACWERHTTAAFAEEWCAGGHHYFQHGDPREVLRIVARRLEEEVLSS